MSNLVVPLSLNHVAQSRSVGGKSDFYDRPLFRVVVWRCWAKLKIGQFQVTGTLQLQEEALVPADILAESTRSPTSAVRRLATGNA